MYIFSLLKVLLLYSNFKSASSNESWALVENVEIWQKAIKNKIITKDDKLKQGFENIKSIIGIGEKSAIVLLHLFLKYPDANQREITSLVGLDPIEKSSGTSVRGKMRISKAGSKIYRGTMFMAVMSAIRHSEYFKIFFERLQAKGKHTTLIQIAVMRKMIVIAHSLYKNNQAFDEKRYAKNCGRSIEEN